MLIIAFITSIVALLISLSNLFSLRQARGTDANIDERFKRHYGMIRTGARMDADRHDRLFTQGQEQENQFWIYITALANHLNIQFDCKPANDRQITVVPIKKTRAKKNA